MTYRKEIIGNYEIIVRFNENGSETWIPIDAANSDYQAYLNRDRLQVEHLTEIVPVSE